MGAQLILMEGIDKSFPGVRALNQCHFDVNRGEVHALVGENGAGKSTLMKILAGIYQRDGGKIFKDRDTAIVIHLDQGGKYHYYEDFFDKAIAHGVTDFDVIGLSYYPFWHGTYNDFKTTMDKLVDRYGKPLVVAEIAYAHRLHKNNEGMFGKDQEEIAGFAATEENQRLVIELLMNITANVKNNMGLGTFYWEPLMIPTAKLIIHRFAKYIILPIWMF